MIPLTKLMMQHIMDTIVDRCSGEWEGDIMDMIQTIFQRHDEQHQLIIHAVLVDIHMSTMKLFIANCQTRIKDACEGFLNCACSMCPF